MANSKLVELASEMRKHSGTSVSELKRKYNHLVPSNERVMGLAEAEKSMSLSEVRLMIRFSLALLCVRALFGSGAEYVPVRFLRCQQCRLLHEGGNGNNEDQIGS